MTVYPTCFTSLHHSFIPPPNTTGSTVTVQRFYVHFNPAGANKFKIVFLTEATAKQ